MKLVFVSSLQAMHLGPSMQFRKQCLAISLRKAAKDYVKIGIDMEDYYKIKDVHNKQSIK